MKCRLLCFALLASASGLGFSQDLSVHVTYKTVAVPASKAIADIAKLTKTDLGVLAPLDSQPLILRFQDLPLKDAMDKIAEVLHGRWTQNKTAFTLERPDDIEQSLQHVDYQERLDAINKALDDDFKYRAQTPLDEPTAEAALRQEKQDEEDEQKAYAEQEKKSASAVQQGRSDNADIDPAVMAKQEAEGQRLQEQQTFEQHQTADGRLCARIFAAIDPATLASLPSGNAVFSTDPRPLQYKLNMSADDWQALVQEQNDWTRAAKKVDPDDTGGSEFWGRKILNPADARIVAEFNTNDEVPDINEIYVVDSKGRQLLNVSSPSRLTDNGEDSQPETNRIVLDKLQLPTIKLSPLAREMISLQSAGSQNDEEVEVRPASPELKSFLFDAANRDPLSLAPSEVLLGVGDAKSWNIAVCLPDDFASLSSFDRADQVSGEEFLNSTQSDGECNLSIKDGWLEISPTKPLKAEQERTNRAALGTFVQAVSKLGYDSIDDMAAFAGANLPKTDPALALSYLGLCVPDNTSFSGSDWNALRFLGLLTDDQKRAMQGEQKLAMTSLSDEQMAALMPIILNPGETMGDDPPGVTDPGFQDDMISGPAYAPVADTFAISLPPDASTPSDPAAVSPLPAPDEQAGQPIADDEEDAWTPLDLEITELVDQLPDPNGTVAIAEAPGIAVKMHVTRTQADQNRQQGSNRYISDGFDGMRITDGWTSPNQIAMAERRRQPGDIYSYATCSKRIFQLKIRLANKATIPVTITENHNDQSPFGPASSLPDKLQQLIRRAAKEFERMRQMPEMQGSDGAAIPEPEQKKTDPPAASNRTR